MVLLCTLTRALLLLQSITDDNVRHDLRADDVLIGVLPLYHIYGMLIMGFNLALGSHLVLLPKFAPDLFLQAMQKHRVTAGFLVRVAFEPADFSRTPPHPTAPTYPIPPYLSPV